MTTAYMSKGRAHGKSRYETVERDSRTALAADVGPVVYAARVEPNTIKIGFTTGIANRIGSLGGWHTVLAFVPGTYEDEQDIHRQLRAHRKRGREYYHPTPEVIGVVNDMRSRYGFDPIEA